MKIFGRAQNDESELELLSETTLVAEPEALRDLASFLYRCADAIEDEGEEWEHDQFDSNEPVCPQVIVFNPYVVTD
jgi:hypothetical protein